MPDLESRFLDKENFYLAFKKLSFYLKQSNEWYNPVELATYEANLATNIYHLTNAIKEKKYSPHSIEPLPFPKKCDENCNERLRQYFRIHIDDQIVWIAIVNIIGDFLEIKMPFWSYGNRLFTPIWYDEISEDIQYIRRGSTHNTSSNLYRKWNQSWPFFRRHISMTIKTMAYNKSVSEESFEDEIEKDIFKLVDYNWGEYKYLKKEYWNFEETDNLYWIGLDYKKFFPSINSEIVFENIKSALIRSDETPRDDVELIMFTISKMFDFQIDITGWEILEDLIDSNKSNLKDIDTFSGLPTGLLVSGFLANVAMIEVDAKINKWIDEHRNVAIFKYVDDQVILSNSKETLIEFLNFYNEILKESNTGVLFQENKIEPHEAFNFNQTEGFSLNNETVDKNKINVEFPEPLLTLTLQKMSHLNDEDYELMSDKEIIEAETDLFHFLLTEFPESEIRRDTRMAFAAMKLCQLAKNIKPNFSLIDSTLTSNIEKSRKKYYLETDDEEIINNRKNKIEEKLISEQTKRLADKVKVDEIIRVEARFDKIFKLLLKAAYENPDKLKLWRRCIEFCYISGIDKLKEIYKEIERNNLHSLSKEYIRSYVNLNINDLLLKSKFVLNNEYKTFWESYTIQNFTKNVLTLDTMNSKNIFPFVVETDINTSIIRNYYSSNTIIVPDSSKNDFECYLWYLLSNVTDGTKLKLWQENIDKISTTSQTSWSIIGLYPQHITLKLFDEIFNALKTDDVILEKFDFKNESEGFLLEIFDSNEEIRDKYIKHYDKINKVLNRSDNNYITTDVWVTKLLQHSNQKKWLDPRLSEWSVLEIIKQISEIIIKEKDAPAVEIIFNEHYHNLFNFHPKNYLIPNIWLTETNSNLTWLNWKDIVRKNPMILAEKADLLNDFRYIPLTKLWKTGGYGWLFGNGEFALIVGLCVLMIKLLSKSFQWPPIANKLAFIDELYSRATYSIETEPISSSTRLLLSAVFSKKEIEFLYGNKDIEYTDQIRIKNLNDFVIVISEIQRKLEQSQLSLMNQSPRQLTYINIDDLNSIKSIF